MVMVFVCFWSEKIERYVLTAVDPLLYRRFLFFFRLLCVSHRACCWWWVSLVVGIKKMCLPTSLVAGSRRGYSCARRTVASRGAFSGRPSLEVSAFFLYLTGVYVCAVLRAVFDKWKRGRVLIKIIYHRCCLVYRACLLPLCWSVFLIAFFLSRAKLCYIGPPSVIVFLVHATMDAQVRPAPPPPLCRDAEVSIQ